MHQVCQQICLLQRPCRSKHRMVSHSDATGPACRSRLRAAVGEDHMPVHIPASLGVRVSFERDGREIDSATAPTGERALKAGILMLAQLDDLRDGDRLTVTETR